MFVMRAIESCPLSILRRRKGGRLENVVALRVRKRKDCTEHGLQPSTEPYGPSHTLSLANCSDEVDIDHQGIVRYVLIGLLVESSPGLGRSTA